MANMQAQMPPMDLLDEAEAMFDQPIQTQPSMTSSKKIKIKVSNEAKMFSKKSEQPS